jgi:SAM-dependent methyltransferase
MAGDRIQGTTQPVPEVNLNIHVPHSARMYDYYLGGTTNFPADREAGTRTLAVFPFARSAARENRGFMRRSTERLARLGLRQFLDVGTGIPTSPNLHEVAQRIASDAQIVYVDNDPIVLAHAQALLLSSAEGSTAYIQGDVREPEAILRAAREVLDFDRPVALSMNAVLHFVPGTAHSIAEEFKAALAPGSALVLSHVTPDFAPKETAHLEEVYATSGTPVQARTKAEFADFFAGWNLLEPGIVVTSHWYSPDADGPRPEPEPGAEPVTDAQAGCYGGVALRP